MDRVDSILFLMVDLVKINCTHKFCLRWGSESIALFFFIYRFLMNPYRQDNIGKEFPYNKGTWIVETRINFSTLALIDFSVPKWSYNYAKLNLQFSPSSFITQPTG